MCGQGTPGIHGRYSPEMTTKQQAVWGMDQSHCKAARVRTRGLLVTNTELGRPAEPAVGRGDPRRRAEKAGRTAERIRHTRRDERRALLSCVLSCAGHAAGLERRGRELSAPHALTGSGRRTVFAPQQRCLGKFSFRSHAPTHCQCVRRAHAGRGVRPRCATR